MVDVESALERMRAMLKKRGAEGLHGLSRNFRICDSSRDGMLNLAEFETCCRLCKLGLSDREVATMHAHFDATGDGSISLDEYLRALRGRMSAPRRNLVVKCFNALDGRGDGNGTLSVEDIAPLFNTSEHPAVLAGEKTHEQVVGEFLAAFEGVEGGDGSVSLDEWVAYYEELSASIDDDDYFGSMLEETWMALTTKGPDGETVPAIVYVGEGEISVLERMLKKSIYQKTVGTNMEKTLKAAFHKFDLDGSGEVSIREFALAMERFGLAVEKPGSKAGGVPLPVLRGLFDRYNVDQSECLSIDEFVCGLFADELEAKRANPDAAVGANPWIPSLEGRPTVDEHYVERPDIARKVRPGVTPLTHMPRYARPFEAQTKNYFR